MLLEARDDAATRQGDGQTTYDGTVQPAAVGMEVERTTDGTVGEGRDWRGRRRWAQRIRRRRAWEWWGRKWKVRQRAHREELGEAGGRLRRARRLCGWQGHAGTMPGRRRV